MVTKRIPVPGIDHFNDKHKVPPQSLNGYIGYTLDKKPYRHRLRIIAVTYKIVQIYEEGIARNRRAFYPHIPSVGQFSIQVALRGWQEKESLMHFIAGYAEDLLTKDGLGTGKGFPTMTVVEYGLKFVRQGIPLTGIEFGNHVGSMLWKPVITFEPVKDLLAESKVVAPSVPDINSRYFYPSAKNIDDIKVVDVWDPIITLPAPPVVPDPLADAPSTSTTQADATAAAADEAARLAANTAVVPGYGTDDAPDTTPKPPATTVIPGYP